MKQVLNQVALFKKIDAGLQIVAFFSMIFIVTQVGTFGLYSFAIIQCISCVLWSLFFNGDTPRYKAGTFIRRVFLIVLPILLLTILNGEIFFATSLCMLFFGPLMGIAYFIIGLKEIVFYNNARKPYYLL
jgi:hypothetical protein